MRKEHIRLGGVWSASCLSGLGLALKAGRRQAAVLTANMGWKAFPSDLVGHETEIDKQKADKETVLSPRESETKRHGVYTREQVAMPGLLSKTRQSGMQGHRNGLDLMNLELNNICRQVSSS